MISSITLDIRVTILICRNITYTDISIMTYKSLLVLENTYKRQKRMVQNLGFVHHSDTTIMLHGNCMICISFNL